MTALRTPTIPLTKLRRRPAKLHLETLEDRTLPVAVPLTNYEQFFLELLNRSRANPATEAALYGIDLNEGLAPGTISPAPKQPLAPNTPLLNAMRAHLADMLAYHFFGHTGSSGSSPFDRMAAAGYTGYTTAGENIAWQGTTGVPNVTQFVADMHEALFVDEGYPGRGHRVNMMNPDFKEVGPGVDQGPYHPPPSTVTYNAVLSGHDLGARPGNSFLTGVVFADYLVQPNQFYTPGEGLGGITVTAMASGGGTYTEVTGSAGGYTLQVPPGIYTVTAIGSGLPGILVRTGVFVGSSNVKVDFTVEAPVTLPPLLTLLADFGTSGLWGWSDAAGGSWRQLAASDASETDLSANGDAFVGFSTVGLWRYTRSGFWQYLSSNVSQQNEVSDDGELFSDFGSFGLWHWQPAEGWEQLTGLDSESFVVTPNKTVYGDFGIYGLWRWTSTGGWQQLTTLNAQQLTIARGLGYLYGDFGSSGVWRWTTTTGWRLLTALDAEALRVSDGGILYGDFGGAGLWATSVSGSWQQVTTLNPVELDVAPTGELYASFDGGVGLWRRTTSGTWTHLSVVLPSQAVVAADGSLYTDFDTSGLWQWTLGGGWRHLSTLDAQGLSTRG